MSAVLVPTRRAAAVDAILSWEGRNLEDEKLHLYTAIHFGWRSAGLHPDYPWTSESSRSFGSETMRSRPKESGKTLRRPTTGRAVLNGGAPRSGDAEPEQRFSGLRSGFRSE